MKRIAVVGASLAGYSCARALRQLGFEGELVLIGDEPHLPYDRPPLSKGFLAGTLDEAAISLQPRGEDLGLDWRLGVRATALDATTRELTLSDASTLRADAVVLATGARARQLAGLDHDLPGCYRLRTLDDALALRAALVPGARLVVVGAGFIGAEVASTARSLGLDVTVVEMLATPLAGPLGVEMGAVISSLHADNGVHLICGVGVAGFDATDRVTAVRLTDGRTLPADVVVVGVGAAPNVEWLAGSGLHLENGVRCNAYGATDAPGIVAVGDCSSWYDPSSGSHHRLEHWTSARENATTAAAWLLSGGADTRASRAPYFWSDQYGCSVRFAGSATGFDEVTLEAGDPGERSFLAVYRRAGTPIGALAIGHNPLFMRWRKYFAESLAGSRPEAEPQLPPKIATG